MKTRAGIIAAALALTFCFPNVRAGEDHVIAAQEKTGVTVCPLDATKDSVEEFFMWLNDKQNTDIDRALLNDQNTCWCYRVRNAGLYIYKDSDTGAAHLAAEDKPVQLTGNDGGLGLTSLALGDLNQDGAYELYFTYSWEPGKYCAQAGYYDTKTDELHYFGDYMCPDSELVFAADNGNLTVCKAELLSCEDKVHFELEEGEPAAQIICSDGQIVIEALSDDFVRTEQNLQPAVYMLPDWVPKNAAEAKEFMDHHSQPAVKDSVVCCMVYISGADSYRANQIVTANHSDVKVPVSYRKYRDENSGDYIVACFEIPPDSYLELYDSESTKTYAYAADADGLIREVSRGDADQDGTADASDLALIEGWLLGKGDFSGCWQPADFNDDCQINAVDMSLLKRSF